MQKIVAEGSPEHFAAQSIPFFRANLVPGTFTFPEWSLPQAKKIQAESPILPRSGRMRPG
jgi:hypothetical protein